MLKKLLRRNQNRLSKAGIALFGVPGARKHYSNFEEEQIIRKYLLTLSGSSGFVIDIAAGDGMTMSNTYSLFQEQRKGLAVECDSERFYRLAFNYRAFHGVKLANCFVTPPNVSALFQAFQVPQNPALLSLDIDGYDYFVLDEILKSYRPSLICVEINEKIPPPIKFTVTYSPYYVWAEDHFYGQSISQLNIAAQKHRYALVELHYNNAFLVPSEINQWEALSPERAYKTGYLDKPDRLKKLPWNQNMETLHTLTPDQGLAHINHLFSKYKGQYTCTL